MPKLQPNPAAELRVAYDQIDQAHRHLSSARRHATHLVSDETATVLREAGIAVARARNMLIAEQQAQEDAGRVGARATVVGEGWEDEER